MPWELVAYDHNDYNLVFQKAAELGLKLGIEPPDTLTLQPARLCPAEFAEVLKAHKPALLSMLRLPFVMVIQTLEETVFFCADGDTRTALIVAQNRVAPLSPAELRKVHEIKRTFSGRLS